MVKCKGNGSDILERYREIERTIIKTYRAHLWAPFVKALKEFELFIKGELEAIIDNDESVDV